MKRRTIYAVAIVILSSYTPATLGGNSALNFNGITGEVTVSSSTGMNLTGAFTLEAWVWPAQFGGRQDLIYKWSGVDYPDQRSYYLQVQPDGRIEFALDTTGQISDGYGLYSSTAIPAGQWTDVAAVYDGTKLALFINGVKEATTVAVPGSAYAGTSPVRIGSSNSIGGESFDGKIDEVRISNIARYTSNFALQQSEFIPDSNTVLLMHMDEGIGTTTANWGMQGGNGILNSGVSWTDGAPVPEPAALSLLALGGLAVIRRRRK